MSSEKPAAGNKYSKYLILLLKLGLVAGIFYFIIPSADSIESMKTANPLYLLPAAACMFIQMTLLTAIRWNILLKAQGINVPFKEIFSLNMQGVFFTLLVAGGAVSGDLVKGGILVTRSKEGEKFNGAFSILIDRITGMIALFSLTLIISCVYMKQIQAFEPVLRDGIYMLLLMCVCALGACVVLFFHDFFFRPLFMRKLLEKIDRISKNAFTNAINAVKTYRAQYKSVVFCILMSMFVMFPLLILALFFLGKAVSEPGMNPDVGTCALASTLSNTMAAIPATPGGLGTRDMMSKSIFSGCGFPGEVALGITLLYTAMFIIGALAGGIFFLFDSRLRARRREPA